MDKRAEFYERIKRDMAAEFVRLRPHCLSGWAFENDVPTAEGFPTIPFRIEIE